MQAGRGSAGKVLGHTCEKQCAMLAYRCGLPCPQNCWFM